MLLLFSQNLFSENNPAFIPEINRLDYSDLNFRQLTEDIEFFHKAFASGKNLPPLLFYSYKPEDDINIFSIASQTGLSYETIAGINRIGSSSENLSGRTLILPSQPGIFLPTNPKTDLEFISLSWRASQLYQAAEINLNGIDYYFFPGKVFHNVERAYFLGILFSNPLPKGIVSSGYGMRKSPFTGHPTFHNGIDIAAPMGTHVYAAREGKVELIGSDEVFGNYIKIQHTGGYETFYGHLNKIFVELHDQVNSTMIIAEVGNTGMSTGPHLHFEVRRDGKAKNPANLTPGLK